ncbi:MAG TPA: UbiA family prenyltransferase [Candidatus Dormibacteraeota bacterium]|nr:UbiA family prenyltransferase [Candidatus Dormibacteraeota bacterium]
MRFLQLAVHMTRYRTTLTLVTFLLAGAVWHQGQAGLSVRFALAATALAAAYASLTSLNDLADERIDRVNLRGHADRPLVAATASRRELALLAVGAAATAVVCAALASPLVGGLVLAAVVLYSQYSLPPLRLSHRPLLTPFCLALGYAVLPYLIGVLAAGGRLGPRDAFLLPGLFALFLARIVHKDFRDRKGDALAGKPTFLLRYGKPATCAFGLTALAAGSALLLAALRDTPLLAAATLPFLAALAVLQVRLARACALLDELVAVGLGARAGNGLLLTLLGLVLLRSQGAEATAQAALYAVIAGADGWLLLSYLRDPGSFTFGSHAIQEAMRDERAQPA